MQDTAEHTLVIAAEVVLPVEMLPRVLRAGWWDYPGGRIRAVDYYCQSCRKLLDKIRYFDAESGDWKLTPCAPGEWLHGGPVGTRKRRGGDVVDLVKAVPAASEP